MRHKLDDIFAQPKAVCNFELVSPVAYESPRTVAALKLFEYSLDEKLNEYAYDAKVRCGAVFIRGAAACGVVLYGRTSCFAAWHGIIKTLCVCCVFIQCDCFLHVVF